MDRADRLSQLVAGTAPQQGGGRMGETSPQWELDCLQRQSYINAYVRSVYQPRVVSVEKILVYHPDEYRRYLQQHPCGGCRAEQFCDQPCAAYLRWYNARLEAARKKM